VSNPATSLGGWQGGQACRGCRKGSRGYFRLTSFGEPGPAHRFMEVPQKPPVADFLLMIEDPAFKHRASGAPCAKT
jgi:hypothetical protein